MTAQVMLDWFNILQDKFASPYFTQDEQLLFLNRAQIQYISEQLPDNNIGPGVELNTSSMQNIAPIIYEITTITADTTGFVPFSLINTELATLSGDIDATHLRVLSVGAQIGNERYPITETRHNDKEKFYQNYFKRPSSSAPKYTYQNGGIQFRPVDSNIELILTVIKKPIDISISPEVNCELPELLQNEIVAIGVEFAGIASRDEALAAMQQLQSR